VFAKKPDCQQAHGSKTSRKLLYCDSLNVSCTTLVNTAVIAANKSALPAIFGTKNNFSHYHETHHLTAVCFQPDIDKTN